MAILPFNELINFKKINAITGADTSIIPVQACRQFHPATHYEQSLPITPINTDYVYISSTIKSYEFVMFECGKSGLLVKTTPEEFCNLVKEKEIHSFTGKATTVEFRKPTEKNNFTPDSEKRSQLERLYKLPSMPQIANALIILKNNPKAHANELAELIKKDPSISAQLIRHAMPCQACLFNYQGEVNSINEAISRVLGFNSAKNVST